MESCLYEGRVRHARLAPRRHAFSKRLMMLYLDLDEIDAVIDAVPLLRRGRFGWASFERSDHLGSAIRPLVDCVRELVLERTGRRPEGPIRLLTHPRHLGLAFNPVSVYYCFEADGRRLDTVVAEVNNTPWGERYCYVVPAAPRDGSVVVREPKDFHVSPFMPMDQVYEWQVGVPGEGLGLVISALAEPAMADGPVFVAELEMERRRLTDLSTWFRFPAMTAQVVVGIYAQALRLWLKRIPFHAHPRERALETPT